MSVISAVVRHNVFTNILCEFRITYNIPYCLFYAYRSTQVWWDYVCMCWQLSYFSCSRITENNSELCVHLLIPWRSRTRPRPSIRSRCKPKPNVDVRKIGSALLSQLVPADFFMILFLDLIRFSLYLSDF